MKDENIGKTEASSLNSVSAQSAFASLASPLVDAAIEHAGTISTDASAETLHKLRVALRRLRSLWWAYRPLLKKDENTRQQALYRYLATSAGKTRDWDILIQLLTRFSGKASLPPGALDAARADALATSRETIANADAKHILRETLSSATTELNTARGRVPLKKFAGKRLGQAEKTLRKRMNRAAKAKRSDYAAFHNVRKAGKKVRYLLELFAPVYRERAGKTVKRLKKVQKRFGKLNDVVASEALLRDSADQLGADLNPDTALRALEKERKHRMRAAVKLL
ncbi:CHAD domain-containing protein [Paraburkholderia sp.]|jgi:CHAD domain-containing protein|uniref:CHAD domain-containing protein n=1 Tax=Paraburkholderia sp. TaxID=1926495 RepID=UPI002F40D8A7